MTIDEEMNFQFWRSIALTVLSIAPMPLRHLLDELGTEQSVQKLQQWNDRLGNRLYTESMNELCKQHSWRN